jgi:hypothetical protein
MLMLDTKHHDVNSVAAPHCRLAKPAGATRAAASRKCTTEHYGEVSAVLALAPQASCAPFNPQLANVISRHSKGWPAGQIGDMVLGKLNVTL